MNTVNYNKLEAICNAVFDLFASSKLEATVYFPGMEPIHFQCVIENDNIKMIPSCSDGLSEIQKDIVSLVLHGYGEFYKVSRVIVADPAKYRGIDYKLSLMTFYLNKWSSYFR